MNVVDNNLFFSNLTPLIFDCLNNSLFKVSPKLTSVMTKFILKFFKNNHDDLNSQKINPIIDYMFQKNNLHFTSPEEKYQIISNIHIIHKKIKNWYLKKKFQIH